VQRVPKSDLDMHMCVALDSPKQTFVPLQPYYRCPAQYFPSGKYILSASDRSTAIYIYDLGCLQLLEEPTN
jgi:hypothetical protein